jgi:hypothetical protein
MKGNACRQIDSSTENIIDASKFLQIVENKQVEEKKVHVGY